MDLNVENHYRHFSLCKLKKWLMANNKTCSMCLFQLCQSLVQASIAFARNHFRIQKPLVSIVALLYFFKSCFLKETCNAFIEFHSQHCLKHSKSVNIQYENCYIHYLPHIRRWCRLCTLRTRTELISSLYGINFQCSIQTKISVIEANSKRYLVLKWIT